MQSSGAQDRPIPYLSAGNLQVWKACGLGSIPEHTFGSRKDSIKKFEKAGIKRGSVKSITSVDCAEIAYYERIALSSSTSPEKRRNAQRSKLHRKVFHEH